SRIINRRLIVFYIFRLQEVCKIRGNKLCTIVGQERNRISKIFYPYIFKCLNNG
ncbi:hypothetical protein M153_232290003, partial [Pseudoloma neurophilia]